MLCSCLYPHTSNIAVMDDNSVATLRDKVDFRLEAVSALDYHVENPSQPQ